MILDYDKAEAESEGVSWRNVPRSWIVMFVAVVLLVAAWGAADMARERDCKQEAILYGLETENYGVANRIFDAC